MNSFLFGLVLMSLLVNPIHGQDSAIKKIIYEDLLTLNSLYDGCIISHKQEKWTIKKNDTIKNINTLADLKESSHSKVSIIQIDSSSLFCFVKVKFDLIAQTTFAGLFSQNTFEYVLYKGSDKYYKVNGFLVSEILYINSTPLERIKDKANINAPNRFGEFLRKRDVVKIGKYLSVVVLKQINDLGYKLDCEPYVKDLVCEAGI